MYVGCDLAKSKVDGTSPATFEDTFGPRSREVMPDLLAIRFVQDSLAVRPRGVTAPRPVTTTLRLILMFADLECEQKENNHNH